MTKKTAYALLLMTAVGLAACSEKNEERTPQEAAEAAEPQNTDAIGDVGPATQEAVSDTQAAVDQAGGDVGQAFQGNEPTTGAAAQQAGGSTGNTGQ